MLLIGARIGIARLRRSACAASSRRSPVRATAGSSAAIVGIGSLYGNRARLLLMVAVLPTMRGVRNARIRAVSVLIVARGRCRSDHGCGRGPDARRTRASSSCRRRSARPAADEAAALRELDRDPDPAPGPRCCGRRLRRADPRRRGQASRALAGRDRRAHRPRPSTCENQAAAARGQLDDAKRRAADAAAAMYRVDDLASRLRGHARRRRRQPGRVRGTKYLATSPTCGRRRSTRSRAEAVRSRRCSRKPTRNASRSSDAQTEADRSGPRSPGCAPSSSSSGTRSAQEEAHEQSLVASIQSQKDQFNDELVDCRRVERRRAQFLAARDSGARRGRRRSTCGVRCPARSPTGSAPASTRSSARCACTPVSTCQRRKATPIQAAAAGVVACAGVQGGYGNAVIIDHGNQFATLYGHASASCW